MDNKLLIFTTDLKIGGTPTVVRELALRLRARNHHVEVGCLAGQDDVARQLLAQGVPVHALGARSARDLGAIFRLSRLLAARNYTRVFSLLLHANAAAALASRGKPALRLFQSIQTTQPDPAWHWRVQRWAARSAERIIVPTPSVAEAAQLRSNIPADKLLIIPNAVDTGRLEAVRPGRGNRRIVFIGRLDPVKRLQDLLAALRSLPSHELHIYGDGIMRNPWQALAPPNAHFHGPTDSPSAALSDGPGADLLVLPSQAEGFGLVLIEAMAAGVPVIASDAPGIRDVVRHEHTGLLYPTADVPALTAAIQRLTSDPNLRTRLVKAARTEVRNRYTWGPVLAAYEQALDL